MKKIQILGLALVALFAFSAASATSALAVSKFLWNNAEITALLFVKIAPTEALLLLEDMNATGKPDVLCNGIIDGKIEAGGVSGFIEEILTSGGLNESNTVSCVSDNGTCEGAVLVTATNLPWHVEVELVAGRFLLHFLTEAGKEPGYLTDCLTFGGLILVEDRCEGLTNALLANEAGGLLAEFSENEEITPATKCTVGGEKQGLLLGDGFITDTEGGTLTVSE
jgi:hypothetical protein